MARDGSYPVSRSEDSLSFFQVFKKLSSIAWPMAISFTFSLEVFLVAIIAGRLDPDDEEHLAAITLMITLMNAMGVFFMSAIFAVNPLMSGKLGAYERARDRQPINGEFGKQDGLPDLEAMRLEIPLLNRTGLVVATLGALPTWASLYFSKELLSGAFGQDEQRSEIASQFLRPYSWAIFGLTARAALEQTMFCFQRTQAAMIMGLSSFAIGIAISVVLSFGYLGAPKLGLGGLAIGYNIETYLTMIAYALYIAFAQGLREYAFFKHLFTTRYLRQQFADVIKLGLTFIVTNGVELAMSLVIGLMAGWLGRQQQASLSFIMQFVFLLFMPVLSFSIVTMQEVSRLRSAQEYQNAHGVAKYGLFTTLLWITPFAIVAGAYPKILVKVLGGNSQGLYDTIERIAPIICAGILFDTARLNLLQVMRGGTNDLIYPTIISVSCLLFGLGLSAVFGFVADMGIEGVCVGYSLAFALACVGLATRWRVTLKPENLRSGRRGGCATFFPCCKPKATTGELTPLPVHQY